MTIRNCPPGLLDDARRGEEQALLALLELAQPDIRRFARSACQVSDVHDAVQEALWILYRKVGALRTAGSLTSWLFMVVRRECYRLLRLGGERDRVGLEVIEDDLRFASIPQEELRLDLARALSNLPPNYRELVLGVDVQEIPVGEVAATLGLTREAAKARLHRARLRLRLALTEA